MNTANTAQETNRPCRVFVVLHVSAQGKERVHFFGTRKMAAQAAKQMIGYARIREVWIPH